MKPGPALDRYRQLAADAIQRFGGRYLARGGQQQVLEGDWAPATIIVEFPTVEAAREWYQSAEYGEALKHRDAALSRDLVVVEGLVAE